MIFTIYKKCVNNDSVLIDIAGEYLAIRILLQTDFILFENAINNMHTPLKSNVTYFTIRYAFIIFQLDFDLSCCERTVNGVHLQAHFKFILALKKKKK